MTNFFKITFLTILIVVCVACEKEYLIVTETEEEGQESIELISTTILGNVLDLSALPLSNVIVDLSVDSKILSSAITEADGSFRLLNVAAKEDNTLLIFHHPDVATSYKVLSLKEDITHYTEIQMIETNIANFNGNETFTYSDDLITYAIDADQISTTASSTLTSKTSVLDKELIKDYLVSPTGGVDKSGNTTYLDHQLVFQINLLDTNGNRVELIEGGKIDLTPTTQFDFNKYNLWKFDERKSVWEIDETVSITNTSTLSLTKTGLYSIARGDQPYLLSGILKDDNGEITSNVKLTIRDENGKIINETYTNSLGEYNLEVINNLKGSIVLSREGKIVEEISFDNVSNPLLTEISLTREPLICKPLSVNIMANNCEADLSPMDLYETDISGLELFTLEINESNHSAWEPDELFKEIDWSNLIGQSTEYTITHLAQEGESPTCKNIITVNDNQAPLVLCNDMITINLVDGKAKIWAQDIDEGSYDNFCTTSSPLIFTIARGDKCDQECEESDFGPTIEFTTEDTGKTIPVFLKGTDIGGMSNQCGGNVVVAD